MNPLDRHPPIPQPPASLAPVRRLRAVGRSAAGPGAEEAAATSATEVARRALVRAAESVETAGPGTGERHTLSPPARMRVAVEWHAASLSYVHRILDPRTGRQIQQLPAAQVLDLVDDLMRQIEKGQ